MLLLNWNERTPELLRQMDEICQRGTRVTLLSPHEPKGFGAVHLVNCRLEHRQGDPRDAASYEKLEPGRFTTAVWLQPESGAGEADDSELLVTTFALRSALTACGATTAPRLVSEVSSPSMKEIIMTRTPPGSRSHARWITAPPCACPRCVLLLLRQS